MRSSNLMMTETKKENRFWLGGVIVTITSFVVFSVGFGSLLGDSTGEILIDLGGKIISALFYIYGLPMWLILRLFSWLGLDGTFSFI